MENQSTHSNSDHAPTYLKILAFIFPLVVMYGPVNHETESPANRELWVYLLAGLITEVTLLLVLSFIL